MKKICIILAILTALTVFSSCGKDNAAENSETIGAKTDDLSFHPAELPDIGKFVDNEKYEYFYKDGPLKEFKAADNYGKIIFYIAEANFMHEKNFFDYYVEIPSDDDPMGYTYDFDPGDTDNVITKYGIATTDGKIITNAIYNVIYCVKNDAGEPRYVAVTENIYSYEGSELDIYIIPEDGSWVKKVDCDFGILSPIEQYNDITIENPTTGKARSYDFDGNYRGAGLHEDDYMKNKKIGDISVHSINYDGYTLYDQHETDLLTRNYTSIIADNNSEHFFAYDEYQQRITVFNKFAETENKYDLDYIPDDFSLYSQLYSDPETKEPTIYIIKNGLPVFYNAITGEQKAPPASFTGGDFTTEEIYSIYSGGDSITLLLVNSDTSSYLIDMNGKLIAESDKVPVPDYNYYFLNDYTFVAITQDNRLVFIDLNSGEVSYSNEMPYKISSINQIYGIKTNTDFFYIGMRVAQGKYTYTYYNSKTHEQCTEAEAKEVILGSYRTGLEGTLSYVKDADGNYILKKRVRNFE